MPRGQHRAEPVQQALTQRARQIPRPFVAAGIGTLLLGVTAGVVLVTTGSPSSSTVQITAQEPSATVDAVAAGAALRIEERTSRDRTRTAAPTTSATSAAAESTSEPAPVPKVVGRLWVESVVNVRSGPSADTARITTLKALSKVGVTGTTKSGWTQVVVDGEAGWVRSTFLSKTKPAARTASASSSSGLSYAPCAKSQSIEVHLQPNARKVYRAVCAAYGSSVSSFGGYRPGDPRDHGTGHAVDIMVSGDPGKVIARFVQAHARELGVTYVIYQQRIWLAGDPLSQWKLMEDRGGTTANHYDHVHVSVS